MKRIIPYILILMVLVGLFSPVASIHAQTPSGSAVTTENNALSQAVKDDSNDCGAGWITLGGSVGGCIIQISYYVFFVLPAFLLSVIATMFNALLAITLSSSLYSASSFIPEAWKIIRDISNIFFILVLLYIAIKIILGLGGHEVKKMIGSVVIMALLINFSMFFTSVVIDASNILALIFYNKIEVKGPNGVDRPYSPVFHSSVPEKDFSGAIVQAFNPARLMSAEMFATHVETITVPASEGLAGESGKTVTKDIVVGPSVGFYLGIIFVSFAVFALASYALLVSGISFLARLIELWVLIIFSPFAFMSYTVPLLAGISSIGWEEWSKRLLKVAFMAPIFMLFLYLISRIAQLNIFKDITNSNNGPIASILLIVIPAAIYMVLLMKATEFAKKGSGEIGEVLFKGAKMVGGLGLAAATGGAGLAIGAGASAAGTIGRQTIGKLGNKIANSASLKRAEARGELGAAALRNLGKFTSGSSFDIRGSKLATAALGKAGIKNLTVTSEVQKGGYVQARKDQVEKRMKRAEELKVGEDEPVKQALNEAEQDLQALLREYSHDIEQLDKRIKTARDNASDMSRRFGAGSPQAVAAGNDVQELKDHRKAIKDGGVYLDMATGITHDYSGARTNGGRGRTINEMEDNVIPDAHHAVEAETKRRQVDYADTIQNAGVWSSPVGEDRNTTREAAHNIIMGAKLDTKDKSGGHH